MTEKEFAMDTDAGRPSRRQLIAGLACTMAVTACSGSSSPGGSVVVASSTPQSPLTPQTAGGVTPEIASWQRQLGSRFSAGGHVLQLTDVEVQAVLNDRPSDLRRQLFTLKFDVVQGGPMEGDLIYTLSNASPSQVFLSSMADPAKMFAFFG